MIRFFLSLVFRGQKGEPELFTNCTTLTFPFPD
jgi:hypothetical protein